MEKVCTLRNMITLFVSLLFVSCSSNGNYQNSSTIDEVKTLSSEDKFSATAKMQEVKDKESGQTIYVIQN